MKRKSQGSRKQAAKGAGASSVHGDALDYATRFEEIAFCSRSSTSGANAKIYKAVPLSCAGILASIM